MSAIWGTYEFGYSFLERYSSLCKPIPYTGGLESRILVSSAMGSVVRTILETPIEYAKVRGMTGQNVKLAEMYTGFNVIMVRNLGIMMPFMITYDYFRRNTKLFESEIGKFIVGGVSATIGYLVIWPFEFVKNQIQCGQVSAGLRFTEMIKHIVEVHGYRGIYRGILPGIQGVFAMNGAGIFVMQYAHKMITECGFRD